MTKHNSIFTTQPKPEDIVAACRKEHSSLLRWVVGILVVVAGGLIGFMLLIRSDTSYTKGQVDVLIGLQQRQGQQAHTDAGQAHKDAGSAHEDSVAANPAHGDNANPRDNR